MREIRRGGSSSWSAQSRAAIAASVAYPRPPAPPARDPLRPHVRGIDHRDQARRLELSEGPVADRERRFGRVPASPRVARERPAELELDLGAELRPQPVRPGLRVPREEPRLADRVTA